jgi:acetyltransferase-like isoleucine patch superfamily enzyme
MNNYIIYPNVKLGKNVRIGEFCIIGLPPKGKSEGEIETVIGDNSEIRSNTVIYAGNIIGSNFQTGHHVMIREDNWIGNNVSVGTGSCIEHHIEIKDGVRIHSRVFIPEYSLLEEECWLGPGVVLTNAKYPRSVGVKQSLKGAHVCRRAKIGANVTLLPGLEIGENCLVGAGSVVVKDVPPGKIVVGNPAKIIGDIKEKDVYQSSL